MPTDVLIIKNLPKNVAALSNELEQIDEVLKAKEIKSFGRRRALLFFTTTQEAVQAHARLQNIEILDRKLIVKYFRRREDRGTAAEVPSGKTKRRNQSTQTINVSGHKATAITKHEYKRNLYGKDGNLDFQQPPPPHLMYAYPSVSKDILNAINASLVSNSRFYTQVLHLMNRMNLEPPFGPQEPQANLTVAINKAQLKDAQTQTDEVSVKVKPPKESIDKPHGQKDEKTLSQADVESELESSSDEAAKTSDDLVKNLKRKLPPSEEAFKRKARRLLQQTKKQMQTMSQPPLALKTITKTDTPEVFVSAAPIKLPKIQIKCSKNKSEGVGVESTRQLSEEELKSLPIYKNYSEGEPSLKLYVKNLAKDVNEDDLLRLYTQILGAEKLNINLMQHGRMKGQAFVTFAGSDEDGNAIHVMSKALKATHGLLLKGKPMIVSYGKKKLGLIETVYVDGAQPENESSSTTKPSRKTLSTQPYNYVIAIDFEATCWEKEAPPNWREPEIIEFPAVLINLKTGKIEAEFHKYIMPIESPKLSAFCTELTGITQKQVDNGIPLQTAIMMFHEWLRKELKPRNLKLPKMSKDNKIGNCAFVTWTDWDFGICLAKECQRKHLKKLPFFNQWIDARAIYREWYKYRPLNFNDALQNVGLTFEGREHSGIDDARNLGSLTYKMVRDGATLAITKDLTPFQLNINCIL